PGARRARADAAAPGPRGERRPRRRRGPPPLPRRPRDGRAPRRGGPGSTPLGPRLSPGAQGVADDRGPRGERRDPPGGRRARAAPSERRLIALFIDDSRYPRALRDLDDPPDPLWIDGDPSLLERPAVSIVGTRRMTPYGARVAG